MFPGRDVELVAGQRDSALAVGLTTCGCAQLTFCIAIAALLQTGVWSWYQLLLQPLLRLLLH